jgi:hypothetical protein
MYLLCRLSWACIIISPQQAQLGAELLRTRARVTQLESGQVVAAQVRRDARDTTTPHCCTLPLWGDGRAGRTFGTGCTTGTSHPFWGSS